MNRVSKKVCVAIVAVGIAQIPTVALAQSVEYLPPTSAGNVVQNIATAYLERDADGFIACLAEDFVFVPHPNAPGLFGGDDLPRSWSKEVAERLHRRMFNGGPGVPGVPDFRSISMAPYGGPHADEEHDHPDWLVLRFNVDMDIWVHGRPAPVGSGHTFYLRPAGNWGGEWQLVRWEESDKFAAIEPPGCEESVSAREVLVEFRRNVVALQGGASCARLEDVDIASSAVESLLVASGVELLGKAFPDFDMADTLGVAHRTGRIVRLSDLSEIYTLRLSDAGARESLAEGLRSLGDVVFAQPSPEDMGHVLSIDPPDDPEFGEQLNLEGSVGDIDALEAWAITTGSADVCIGILDTGFVMDSPSDDHEDLTDRILLPRNLSDYGHDDNEYHAFATASTAGAMTNNGIGVAGVDWNARLMSKRVLDVGGPTDQYDKIMGAAVVSDILNNSWGSDEWHWIVQRAFMNAYKLNCVSVAAMGNEPGSSDPLYPAAYGQGIVAVSCSGLDGGYVASRHGNHVDVAAPCFSYVCYIPPGEYRASGGTSMAAPQVSGIAALLLAERPDLRNDDIEQLIRITAIDIEEDPAYPGWDPYTGTGRVSALRALEALRPPYSLSYWTASGATSYTHIGNYQRTFLDVPQLPNGTYETKVYEVFRDVTFGQSFISNPNVWGRGLDMMDGGYSAQNPNYGLGWCKAVDGSITLSGCTLRTYVYKVYNISGFIGWFPCEPSQVTFAYSAHGCLNPGTGVAGGDHSASGSVVLQLASVNPSGQGATLVAGIPRTASSTLRVFSVTGRVIRTLWQGQLTPGEHPFVWDGMDAHGKPVASGVYYIQLETEQGAAERKVVIVR